jgi:hypothetical protein
MLVGKLELPVCGESVVDSGGASSRVWAWADDLWIFLLSSEGLAGSRGYDRTDALTDLDPHDRLALLARSAASDDAELLVLRQEVWAEQSTSP